jgi:hypothetical protein
VPLNSQIVAIPMEMESMSECHIYKLNRSESCCSLHIYPNYYIALSTREKKVIQCKETRRKEMRLLEIP